MKRLSLFAVVLLLGAALASIGTSHQGSGWQGMPMMGSGMMMGRGMMGYGTMVGTNTGCPMMMGLGMSADFYLSYDEEIGLSKDQVTSLKALRDSYGKQAIALNADLQKVMLELRNILNEDNVDLSQARAINKQIERIQTDLRLKNIEAYDKARRVLMKQQLKKIRSMSMPHRQGERGHPGMMNR
ncbi:MAG: Spy/CpxP family protein refolding chaperone [bacterium]